MHLEQLPSGSWRVSVSANNRRARGTAATKNEAKMLGARLLIDLGGRPKQRSTSVAELLALHLSQQKLSPTTEAEYRRVLPLIPAWLLEVLVVELGPEDLDRAYAHIGRTRSAHRVRRVHELLSAALERAVRWRWITANPARSARPPEVARADITPPSPDQVRALLAAANVEHACFLRLAATSGARRGELCGLQWGDISTERAEMVIRRAVVATTATGTVVRDVKTGAKGHRVVALDLPTLAAVRRWKTAADQRALKAGHRLGPTAFLFSADAAGTMPIRPESATQWFDRLRDKVGASNVRLHDLRHFVATQMLTSGVAPAVVAGRLGHATPATTFSRYHDFISGSDRPAADALAGIIDGTGPR